MLKLFLITCIISFSFSIDTKKDHIKWRVVDWSPMYIQNGIYKNQGIYDNIISNLSHDLKNYKHSKVIMNTTRVLYEMKQNKKICHPSVLKNTDAKLSVMNSIILPHQIIIHKKALNKLGNVKQYSLKKLLNNPNLKGGITLGRYSKDINNIIDSIKNKKHLFLTKNYNSLVKMLLYNRVDYIIEYAAVVNFKAHELSMENRTISLDITDSKQKEFLSVYTACPKNKWGMEVVKKINTSLINESKNNFSLNSRIKWFSKEDQEKLKKLYEKYYFLDKRE